MNNHLILISRERVIGTDTTNLVYTEIKIRTKKHDGAYLQSKEYPHLVEKELTKAEIANFKANRHLYKMVQSNSYGTIYQFGSDFKELYWSKFPKEDSPTKEKKERTHKVCSNCEKKLPIKDFYVRQNGHLFARCKKCSLNISNSQNKKLSLQKTI